MSKPDWKDAPDWANYTARDEDGAWWWYEELPRPNDAGEWFAYGRRQEIEGYATWKSTLERRPVAGKECK